MSQDVRVSKKAARRDRVFLIRTWNEAVAEDGGGPNWRGWLDDVNRRERTHFAGFSQLVGLIAAALEAPLRDSDLSGQ